MAESYIQIIFIDDENQARHTNLSLSLESNAATRLVFNGCRRHKVGIKEARFLLDYYNNKGDLADSIPISPEGFRAITGKEPMSNEAYCKIDAEYWAKAQADWKVKVA